MDRVGSAIIDFTEAAYDFELGGEEWLPAILRRGLPALAQGLGVAGMRYGRPPDEGPFQLLDIHVASGPEDFAERHAAALATTPPEALRENQSFQDTPRYIFRNQHRNNYLIFP